MTHKPPQLMPRTKSWNHAEFDVPHPRPFLCDLRVSRDELSGTIEHVSNIEYVRWLDRAAELHSDSVGYTRAALLARGVMWFVGRHEIDYLGETWLDDELVIATWARSFRRVKSWRDYMIIRPKDNRVVCRASTLWVLVDLASRRPTRISREMIERFDPLTPETPNQRSEMPCTSQ